jgi:hypothetical protein
MDRDELQEMVANGLTVRQIAAQTGKGYSTIRYWLAKHGLETLHRGPGRASRLGVNARVGKRHGAVPFATDTHGTRCSKCRSEGVSSRRRRVKQTLVDEAGGCCAVCGYDRYAGALQFHHLDPSKKSFALSLRGLTRSIERLREEAAKCRLVCANCHAEIEGGITRLV